VDISDNFLEREDVFMGTARHQYRDEFEWEAVGLLASSGRPLNQLASELGISAARLRTWRNRNG